MVIVGLARREQVSRREISNERLASFALLLSGQLCWEMNDEEIRFKDIGIQKTENVSE